MVSLKTFGESILSVITIENRLVKEKPIESVVELQVCHLSSAQLRLKLSSLGVCMGGCGDFFVFFVNEFLRIYKKHEFQGNVMQILINCQLTYNLAAVLRVTPYLLIYVTLEVLM